ncbi:hypothetical protein V8D89_004191 [Ganoderma adspersum]
MKKDNHGHRALARTVTRILESDNPVLFPNLVHLDLVVCRVPLACFTLVACTLVRRDEASRHLPKLRVSDEYLPPTHMRPDYKKTGIFDHVDSADISYLNYDADAQELGWGRWKDCVERADHGYWQC